MNSILTTTAIATTATSISHTYSFTDLLGNAHVSTAHYVVGKLGTGSELHLLWGVVPACRNRSRRAHSAGRFGISALTCEGCIERRDALLAEQAALLA